VILLVMLSVVARPVHACGGGEEILVANIGHAPTADPPSWSTITPPRVDKNQAIYFHALNSAGEPLQDTNDQDYVGGQIKQDTAHYDWDYCYNTDVDTHSLHALIAYPTPGNRTVHLAVDDEDGDGYTDDDPEQDEMLLKVTMTVETDWMSGYQLVSMDVFPGRWSGAGYGSVAIDADHDSNCTHHEYLYDHFATDAALTAYLDSYENQDCDLYLIGIDKWSRTYYPNAVGFCWPKVPPHRYACIFRGEGAGLSVELHETACHDATVGAIGHCTSGDVCACKDPVSASTFCASCNQEMRDDIKSRSP
jgi:hypothetical protein